MLRKIDYCWTNWSCDRIAAWDGYVGTVCRDGSTIGISHPSGKKYFWTTEHSWKSSRTSYFYSIRFLTDGSLAVSDTINRRVVVLSLQADVVDIIDLSDVVSPSWSNVMDMTDKHILFEYVDLYRYKWYAVIKREDRSVNHLTADFALMHTSDSQPLLLKDGRSFAVTGYSSDSIVIKSLKNRHVIKEIQIPCVNDVVELRNGMLAASHREDSISLVHDTTIIDTVQLSDISSIAHDAVTDNVLVQSTSGVYILRFWHLSTQCAFVTACVA